MRSEHVTVANWRRDKQILQKIRHTVFIVKQSVPQALEWDGLDDDALHLIATSKSGEAVGTARLLNDGHVGRVAVLKPWRHHGIGTALMQEVANQAEQLGFKQLKLAAQIHAIPFYTKLGFITYGDAFMDAGIPHRKMRKPFG